MGPPLPVKNAELKGLIAQRENIEAEIAALTSSLEAPGMPGVSGPLVDREGFPLVG